MLQLLDVMESYQNVSKSLYFQLGPLSIPREYLKTLNDVTLTTTPT